MWKNGKKNDENVRNEDLGQFESRPTRIARPVSCSAQRKKEKKKKRKTSLILPSRPMCQSRDPSPHLLALIFFSPLSWLRPEEDPETPYSIIFICITIISVSLTYLSYHHFHPPFTAIRAATATPKFTLHHLPPSKPPLGWTVQIEERLVIYQAIGAFEGG